MSALQTHPEVPYRFAPGRFGHEHKHARGLHSLGQELGCLLGRAGLRFLLSPVPGADMLRGVFADKPVPRKASNSADVIGRTLRSFIPAA